MRAGTPGTYDGLADEFVMSIIEARKPLVNIAWALNMTVAGIVNVARKQSAPT